MAPPGKRKMFFCNLVPLLLIIVFATSASAASAVLGIDFGTEYIKAAIARPGSPIEIVLTKDSKRKEAAALTFKPSRTQIGDDLSFPERLYGGDALALAARFPSDAYANLKSIMGLPSKSREVRTYLSRYPGLRQTNIPRLDDTAAGSTVGFKSQSFKKDSIFSVEELLSMELKNIKANAEFAAGKNVHVNDVVITYPAFYTAQEKRAIELAAELAGLRVLGLISDGLAVGLNYATHRSFDSVTNGAEPEYHIVYDMGAGSTTATVLKFQGKTVKGPGKRNQTIQEVQVVGYGADRNLGGDALNDLVVDDMVQKFLESPRMKPFKLAPINIKTHGKTMARLWKDAERVRQVLSANSVAHSSQEGLYYEDVNFKYNLTRDDFEKLTQDHAARVSGPLNQALLMADLRSEDLKSIILHGGMVRTPFVQKQLEMFGGAEKIKTNVNADEAAAMGAAFKAASISPSFRVKDIRAIDISGVPYLMSWSAEGKTREQKVFVPTSQTGIEKQITIKSLEDFSLDFKQDEGDVVSEVVSVKLTNLTKSANELREKHGCASTNITTVFYIRLSPSNGVPELVSGSVSCKAEKVQEGSVMDKAKGLFGFGKKDQAPLKDDDEHDSENQTPLPVDDPTSSGTTVSSPSATSGTVDGTSTNSVSVSPKGKPMTVTISLSSEHVIKGLNQPPVKDMSTMKQRLSAFDASDRTAIQRAEALNVLEAFTYRARDYLDDESFITVSTDETRKELEQQLSSVSEWLYGDGVDAKLDDFKQKLKGLKSIVDPVLTRREERSKRDSAIKALEESLSSSSGMIDMIKKQIEKNVADTASEASLVTSSVVDKASSIASSAIETEDLDEDPYATGTSSASAAEFTEDAAPKPYQFTEEDLSTLSKAYDTAKSWLGEKLELQSKLTSYDNPAVLVSDLDFQAKKLQQSVSDLIMKQIKLNQPKPKKPKSVKGKGKSKKNKSSTETETVASSSLDTPTYATPSSSRKDEL